MWTANVTLQIQFITRFSGFFRELVVFGDRITNIVIRMKIDNSPNYKKYKFPEFNLQKKIALRGGLASSLLCGPVSSYRLRRVGLNL
jgi:hypothetical protein